MIRPWTEEDEKRLCVNCHRVSDDHQNWKQDGSDYCKWCEQIVVLREALAKVGAG